MFKLTLGSAPYGERCAQTVDNDYDVRGPLECNAFAEQLKRCYKLGTGSDLPKGVCLSVTSHPHDFRTYYEVTASVSSESDENLQAVIWLEAHAPEEWDEVARKELGLPDF